MKTKINSRSYFLLSAIGAICCGAPQLHAATSVVYGNNFETYTNAASSFADVSDADPVGVEWNIADDAALLPTTAGAGVQIINWLTNATGAVNQSLLLRAGTEAQVFLRNAKSGSQYQLDFKTYAVREATSSQNFLVVLRGEGSDYNGDDYLAYRVDRATNSTALYYYDGVGPGAAAWTLVGANQTTDKWQHHRIVIDPNAMTYSIYVDNMETPVKTGADLARPEVGVPTILRLVNEGNTADDGYYAIDDFTLTVEDSKAWK